MTDSKDLVRTVRFILPLDFCKTMDIEAREWAKTMKREPTKAIREAYIRKKILEVIDSESWERL